MAELYRRFVESPDFSKRDFVPKLLDQLAGADPIVFQLAGEMLYVLLLPQDTNPDVKRKNVTAVLGASADPVSVPPDLAAAFDDGIASYGAALTQRYSQYVFLLEFGRAWSDLDADQRAERLSDPAAFHDFVFSLPRKGASSQVEALLHVVFPDAYEPIVSVDVKQKIVSAFSEYVGNPAAPIDEQIAEIRHALASEYGEEFGFYDSEVRSRWDVPGAKSSHVGQAWFLRGANDRGVNRIPTWLRDGFVSIGWEDSAAAVPGMSISELAAVIATARPDKSQQWVRMGAGNLQRFFDRMSLGDLVVTVDGNDVYAGHITGEPTAKGSAEDGVFWQRSVLWLNPSAPLDRSTLLTGLQSSLKTQVTLTDISKHAEALKNLLGPIDDAADSWSEFLHWTQKLFEHASFDSEERAYKLEAARLIAEAREALERGDDWLGPLKRAFGGENNLLDWRARGTFLDWCANAPGAAAGALLELWGPEEITDSSVDRFAAAVLSDTRPGNRIAIASLLLMGIDACRFPPFRSTVDQKARKLLGFTKSEKAIENSVDEPRQPEELARELGVTGRTLRGFLRKRFPRGGDEKNARWELDAETVRAVAEHFRPGSSDLGLGERYFAFLDLADELRERLLGRGVVLRDRLDAQSLLWWVTSAPPPEDWNQEDREAFLAYQQGRKAVIVAPSIGQVPPVADDFAQRLFLPRPWLQQAIDLLNEKRQIIFYGPPGTGKTFVAQALAEHIEAAGGEWQLVQFHPTYSYEDFFEGYRPSKAEDGRTLQFDLRKGPLRLLAEKAAQNPQKPYLLVIDEINRGNIAKVFGELYFLLEYRDQPIRLQYSPEETFELPENLFVIGTMNTADRSIALVDSALRRRFYFFGFLPQEPPVEDVLAAWLEEKGYGAGAASLLRALNDALHEALPDEEFAIGPSYFMPKDGPPQLEKIWRYSIKPLLEERLYGTLRADEIERDFGLSAMQKRASGSENEGDEAESAS
jgi:hypothetical protein